MKRIVYLACILLLTATVGGPSVAFLQSTPPQSAPPVSESPKQEAVELVLGKPVERELKGGETHTYTLNLKAGEFVHVEVEQKGIDVRVAVFGPDGKQIADLSTADGLRGNEPVYFVTDEAGRYRLEIGARDKDAQPGRYEPKLLEQKLADQKGRDLTVALTLFCEGRHLLDEGTKIAREEALKKYEAALVFWKSGGDQENEGRTLNDIGAARQSLGQLEEAIKYHQQALTLFRSVGSQVGESQALAYIGQGYSNLDEHQKALDYFAQALPIFHFLEDSQGEAVVFSSLGVVYKNLYQSQKAIDAYSKAISLFQTVGDQSGEAVTLNNISSLYLALGENRKAFDYGIESLRIFQAVKDKNGEATILNFLGRTLLNLGEYQYALEFFLKALILSRELEYRQMEAHSLNNIGTLYRNLGEQRKAIDWFLQALPLHHEIGNRIGEAQTLNNIGGAYIALDEPKKALDHCFQAMSLQRSAGDKRGEGYTLINIGNAYVSLKDHKKAIELFEQAFLLFHQASDQKGKAAALSAIGAEQENSGDHGKALDTYSQAAFLFWEISASEGEAKVLYNSADVERDQGNLLAARTKIEKSIKLVETIRSNVSDQNLRSSYFATVRSYYDLYIDILMRMHKADPKAGHDLEAFQVSERARARSLLELLVESRADIRQGADPQLLEQERSLQDRLKGKQERLTRLLVGKHTPEQADEAKKEIDALTDEYRQVQTKIRQTSPRYAALTQPEPLTVKQLQQDVLDSDTVLLEYALGEDKSYLWAVTKDTISGVELPKRGDIEPTARKLYDLLKSRGASGEWRNISKADKTTPQGEYLTTATALSKLLLSPVADKLGNKRLVVVADGALQYIPFAALPEPESIDKKKPEPLVVRHEIVSLPSASALAVLRNETKDRQPAPKTLAVLADPVFSTDDQRIAAAKSAEPSTQTAANLTRERVLSRMVGTSDDEVPDADRAAKEQRLVIPRLPYTRDEAEQIGRFAESDRLFKALDFQASRETATGDELSRYRYVHFATHGLLDAERPELSSIVLSLVDKEGKVQDGFLRAFDVYNLNLPAEVVTLSACKTGLGKDIKGEGLVGLTRGFMYAGARRVVVSLWAVNDKATAELMTRFYRKMLKEGQRPAAALRMAQVEMWRDKQWNAPFYWAGFTLQGEWR